MDDGRMDGWMDRAGPCGEGQRVHGLQPAGGLCHEPLTRANVANPHPRSATVWGGKITWRSTQTHSRTCFSASSVPAALLFAPCIPRRHSYTDNPANEGAVAPRGAWSKTLECSKGSWPVGTVFVLCFVFLFLLFFFLTAAMSFWTGNALKIIKSWRTTWWYCVTTKNCWN